MANAHVGRAGKARALDDPQAVSMAKRLEQWRLKSNRPHVPELDLLRDTLYVLQGIDGTHVKFIDLDQARRRVPKFSEDGEMLVEPALEIDETNGYIAQSTRDLLHRLAELGFLFRQIDQGLKSRAAESSRGLIEQSLAHALRGELTAYFRLIALLESRLSAASAPTELQVTDELQAFDDTRGLTLRRLLVYTNEMKLRLRFAAVMVESCSTDHGGALVSRIYSYTSHGDPFVRSFTDALLDEVSKPFFATLARWIHEGELDDPYKEFFVANNEQLRQKRFSNGDVNGLDFEGEEEDDDDDSQLAISLWDRKFNFREDMLPDFVGQKFGRKIFSTGKSLNFLKYSCGDADWVQERRQASAGKELEYSDVAGLEHSIDTAYSIASQRLFEVFFDRFHLLDHLRAIKDYLMLGKGDFVDVLMEQMAPSLSRPANTLFRHNLTATLETAIRGSTSANDSEDVLRRLDARMQDFQQGDVGWDAFTLEYKVDAPLDTVLDAASMGEYLRLFNQLWRMKRVEVAVTHAWQRIVTGAKTFYRVKVLHSVFHRARLVLSAMTHFIRSLQYFCHLEVIECGWQGLEEACLKKQGDLDSLLHKHRSYITLLSQRILLFQPKGSKPEILLDQVRNVFRLILLYQATIDSLCNDTLEYAADEVAKKDSERGIASTPTSDTAKILKQLEAHRLRLESTAAEYEEAVLGLYTALANHQIMDMRFLAARLNFNFVIKDPKGKKR